MTRIEVTNDLMGELALQERGRILAPGRISEWNGQYFDGTPKTLHHTGRSAETEVFMTAYLKVASKNPSGDYRWIPVLLTDVETTVNSWERKEIMGSLGETVDRCCRHETFRLVIYQGETYIMPTPIGIKIMTDAGRQIMP